METPSAGGAQALSGQAEQQLVVVMDYTAVAALRQEQL
jgi:hypothetical protein